MTTPTIQGVQGIPDLSQMNKPQDPNSARMNIHKVDNGYSVDMALNDGKPGPVLVFNDKEEAELKTLALVQEIFKKLK